MHRVDSLKYKKKLGINSLYAAICNVALFKTMKQKQFRDEIFISYSQEGVILQTINQQEWEKASRFVDNFLQNKKIALLGFGYEKQVWEELINRGLKEYTRRVKQLGEECPYINIIHYQKLRKSCEYMDKQKYVEPLRDWQRKNKSNPNFAYLIVEPAQKYPPVKKRLLQHLLRKQIPLSQCSLCLISFLLVFFNSSEREEIKDAFDKKLIEVSIEAAPSGWLSILNDTESYRVNLINFTSLKMNEMDGRIVSSNKNLSKLGIDFISRSEVQNQISKVKIFLTGTVFNQRNQTISVTKLFEDLDLSLSKKYGDKYCLIPFRSSEREKYTTIISKLGPSAPTKDPEHLLRQIEKNVICAFQQIQFMGKITNSQYQVHKACINDCPYLIHSYYNIPLSQIDTFLLYLEQLRTYYCTYLVRYHGLSISHPFNTNQLPATMNPQQRLENQTYHLIFDYHHRNLQQMLENDLILDNFQVAQINLQLLYLVQFLHQHEEPRCLGSIKLDEVYWPLAIVLPYLRSGEEERKIQKANLSLRQEGLQGDVRLMGLVMKNMLQYGDTQDSSLKQDYFGNLVSLMVKVSKYERISLAKCISSLEQLLAID